MSIGTGREFRKAHQELRVVQFENWPRQATLRFMLYLVIERFRLGCLEQIAERFARCGRMLPEGLLYHSSWVDSAGTRCFQLMETPEPELLKTRMGRWNDLVDFEVVPVLSSADFWAKR